MSRKATIFLERTKVSASQTQREIVDLLVTKRAQTINFQYENQRVIGMTFTLEVADMVKPYKLPVRVEGVHHRIFGSQGSKAGSWEQAERIAWRQLYLWLKAQIALVESGMSSPAEVLHSYLVNREGQTTFEEFRDRELKQLTSGGAV